MEMDPGFQYAIFRLMRLPFWAHFCPRGVIFCRFCKLLTSLATATLETQRDAEFRLGCTRTAGK
jgi:hypothetical protein